MRAVEPRDVELPLPRDARLLAAELVDAPLQRRVPRALGLDPGRLEDREDEPVWKSTTGLGGPHNFRTLYLGQFEVDSADFWTDRLLSSSSRSTAEEFASKLYAHIEVGLKI